MRFGGQILLAGIAHLGSACLQGQVDLPQQNASLPAWPGSAAAARRIPGKFVFQDASGEIIVSYPDPANPTREVTFRFWLHNRIAPSIAAAVKHGSDDSYHYTYSVGNGNGAKTSIREWSLAGPPSTETEISHRAWQGVNAYKAPNAQNLFKNSGSNVYLSWIDMRADEPIAPGHELSGFEVVSPLRPGLTVAYLGGTEAPITVPENSTDEVDRQIMLLERWPVMEKVAVTIGPRFAKETDRREIIRAFQRDIREAAKGGFLDANSQFVQELMSELAKAEETAPYTVQPPAEGPGNSFEKEVLEALRVALVTK
jgi:hypothetical protein